jgi:type II secretory pathway component GspD/PulD (secretin)
VTIRGTSAGVLNAPPIDRVAVPFSRVFAMEMLRRSLVALLLLGAVGLVPRAVVAQQATPSLAPVSVTFEDAEVKDVLAFFARYASRSIVSGAGVAGRVSATIDHQRWDLALQAILQAHGFYAREMESGIIIVEDPASVVDAPVPLQTRVFRLDSVPAAELQQAVASVLSKRGTIASVPSMNALVVTDEPRVLEKVATLIGKP